MLDDQDIQKLKSVFATKGELADIFDKKLSPLVADISILKNDVKELKEDVGAIKEIVQGHSLALDGLAKSFDKLDNEYVSMKNQVNRHETWHHQVAESAGVKLEV